MELQTYCVLDGDEEDATVPAKAYDNEEPLSYQAVYGRVAPVSGLPATVTIVTELSPSALLEAEKVT